MKKTYLILLSIIFGTSIFAQDCTNCSGNGNTGHLSSILGIECVATGEAAFASGYQSVADGQYTTSMGFQTEATGQRAVAIGYKAKALEISSISLGSYVTSSKYNAIVIGSGLSVGTLINNKDNSLMIGFNSIEPSFYVGPAPIVSGNNATGKIGIGTIEPSEKLHIKAYEDETAAVFIEPNNWSAGGISKLILGNTFHSITTNISDGMKFESENNFIFNGGNLGFGVEEPKAKVHINGDLIFEHSLNGIIMKSEDGNCWKGTISNNGELIFSQVDCETLSSTENITEPKHSEVFIYPNPTTGQITVEYTGNKKNLRLEIKSISGLLVATYKIKKGENRIELNNISDQMIIASVFTKNGELISTNKVVVKK